MHRTKKSKYINSWFGLTGKEVAVWMLPILKKEGMGVYIIYPRARGGSGITPGYSGNSNQPSPYISS